MVLLKRRRKGEGKLLGLQGVAGRALEVLVGWAGGVVRRLIVREPLRRCVYKAGFNEISLDHGRAFVSHHCGF